MIYKYVFIFGFFLVSSCATIQTPDTTPVYNLSYQETIEAPGQSQQQLFEKSKQWISLTYVSAKKVIDYENSAEGKIIGKGSTTIPFTIESGISGSMTYSYPVGYILTEEIKSGKVRVTINNIQLLDMAGRAYSPMYADGWKQLQPQLVELCNNLKQFLNKETSDKNW